jgi:hypothetical protein
MLRSALAAAGIEQRVNIVVFTMLNMFDLLKRVNRLG